MLVLQGLKWAMLGRHFDVVSDSPANLAVSVMIQHQLQMTLRNNSTASPPPGTVRLHQYDFNDESDVDKAVSELLSVVHEDTLCVLMDETHLGR